MGNTSIISYTLLLGIVFLSGILGGVINYLMHNFSRRWSGSEFTKCLLYGIIFSSIVMFFLQLLVDTVSNHPYDMRLIYVVFGFVCFIGAVFLYLGLQLLLRAFRRIDPRN